jgi:hypothetical protein
MESVLNETMLAHPYGTRNTGTYMMTDTLRKTIDADRLIPRFHQFDEAVDTVVTNIFHRVGGDLKVDLPYWENILKWARRVVPLSLGFAFVGGQIAPPDKDLTRLLKMFAERVELGVRGEYDAEALHKIGIKNVKVIGCPSLYYHMDRTFAVDNSNWGCENINVNFSTDFGNVGITQKEAVETHWPLLGYFIRLWESKAAHIDLTLQKPPFAEAVDIHSVLLSYGEVHPFYSDCGRYFYSAEDWISGVKGSDFSIGTRFHGNIAAILAGVPTLMINIDKRMEEMNRFYRIPSIDIAEFDAAKPIEYYRELADYSDFNKNYERAFDDYINYCNNNSVALKGKILSRL